MGVVLGKAAHAQQAVHDAGALVAIDGAELAVARGQIAVGLERVLVDEDVERTVHGLHAVFRVVQFHGGEHVLRVVAVVAGGLPEVGAGDVRGEDERVAAAEILVAHPVFHLFADEAALGMPEDEAGAGELLNGEQVELLAEQAMVALLGFFELVEVVVELLLGVERRAVDALELRVLLVAQPVGSGDVEQLEGLDASGGRDVRAAAEVGELAGLVDRDFFIGLGELLDEVALHEVAFGLEALQAFGAGQKFARVGQVLLGELLHLLLDGGEVVGGEGLLAVEVVEESVLGGGAVAELGLGKEFEDGGGHQVRGGVAEDFERFGIALGEQAEFDVAVEGASEVDRAAGLSPLVLGLIWAARAASARRGLMPRAMSRAVVPEGTSLTLPSGSFTWMSSDMNCTYGCGLHRCESSIQ